MTRLRCIAVAAVLPLALLTGCASDSGTSGPTASSTEEAIVGGIETVAPGSAEDGGSEGLEEGSLTADELAAVIEGAGDGYGCEATGSGFTCKPSSGDAAAITIVGTADDLASVTAKGAVPADTVGAVAEALGVEAAALGDGQGGLSWQQG